MIGKMLWNELFMCGDWNYKSYCVILCEVCLVSGFVWKDFEENGGKFILRNFIFVIFCKILVCVGKSILLYYGII